jgi:hypothetical protein
MISGEKMKYLFTILLLAASSIMAHAQDPKLYTELLASSEKIVKGAPFSAEAVNESVQTLADGNRIVRTSNSKMFRDGEGRFRREGSVNSGGPIGFYYAGASTSTITDPVTGFKYILSDKDKTVRRWVIKTRVALNGEAYEKLRTELKGLATTGGKPSPEALVELEKLQELRGKAVTIVTAPSARSSEAQAELERALVGKAAIASTAPLGSIALVQPGYGRDYKTNNEELGTRNIEGVEAEGTRTTTTIPAGAIGNERPIDIVYEKWYSKELQLIVYSKHSDPRYGDQTYRLTNISRSEPDPGLFAVPAEYKVLAEGYAPTPGSVYRIATAGSPASPPAAPKPAPAVKPASAPRKPQ